jgi:hypothetical protein
MANLSTFMAKYAADYIKGAALNDDFQTDASLEAYPFYLALALFTEGVDEKKLARGFITPNYSNDFEVRANADTKYVRKLLSEKSGTITDIWSAVFDHSDISNTFPSGVELPTTQKGYAMMYNNAEILWNDSPNLSWNNVTHFAVLATQMVGWDSLLPDGEINDNHAYANPHTFDGPRDEYVLMWGKFETPKVVGIGDMFRFPIGSLQVKIY